MDSSRLLDSARDPYARRQAPSMALPTSLSSGQPYYTVESLEGASSLPFLKPGLASSAPLPSERDALLHFDAQTRALLADRETLDARARLLASEREALLRRSLPGSYPLADRRAYVDGLPPLDARTRQDVVPGSYLADRKAYVDGVPLADARTRQDVLPPADARTRQDVLPPTDARTRLDGLPALDARTRASLDDLQAAYVRALAHELDRPPHDALRRGIDDRGRAPAAVDGPEFGAQERRNVLEMVRNRDVTAVARNGTAPFYPPVDSFQSGRDVTDVRTPAIPIDSSFRRRDIADVRTPADSSFRRREDSSFRRRDIADVRTSDSSLRWRDTARQPSASSFRPQSERPLIKRSGEPAAPRFAHAEAARKQNKTLSNVTKPPPEHSEGWCALCKIDCGNVKSLGMHLNGKKHKAMVEGNPAKANEDLEVTKSTPAVSTQAERKRASEAKPEASQKAKRPKTISASTIGNGAPTQDATDAKRGKGDGKVDHYKEKAKKLAAENGKDNNFLVCEVCNITATGKKNLESHLKGKRHLARLRELASS